MAKYTYLYEIPSFSYAENVVSISRTVFAHSRLTCYVTLNKTAGMVRSMLLDGGVFVATYSFVDGISSALFGVTDTGDTVYVRYPPSLEEIERAIWTTIRRNGADAIIFDSLSTLTTRADQQEIIAFFHRLIAQLAEQHIIAVFLCLLEDQQKELIAHIAMMVDEVHEVRK